MSKNQKPARKPQTEKEVKVTATMPTNEGTCKCDTAKDIFKMVPEYDEIVTENNGLKLEITLLKKENKEACDKLNADIKTLQSMLRKRDERIESLEGNVEFYRTRGVWKTILYHWFGC